MKDFNELSTTKKGDIGEAIVQAQLIQWNYTLYQAPKSAHPVDCIAWKNGTFTAVEVKTYPRLFSRPVTGIDEADYKSYQAIEQRYCMPVKLFFVDEAEAAIYGATVRNLSRAVKCKKGKAYFPLSCMKFVRRLSANELESIYKFSNVDYSKYITLPKYFSSLNPKMH